jgi:hypothetical protein
MLAYGVVGLTLLATSLAAYGPALLNAVRVREPVVSGAVAWAVFAVLARGLVESDGSVVFLRPSSQSFLIWLIVGCAVSISRRPAPQGARVKSFKVPVAARRMA